MLTHKPSPGLGSLGHNGYAWPGHSDLLQQSHLLALLFPPLCPGQQYSLSPKPFFALPASNGGGKSYRT